MADETHYPNIASALLDLHRLLAMFMASEGIASLPQRSSIRRVAHDIERDEITRILLVIAATVRIVEDRTFGRAGMLDLFLETSCGDLVPDVSNPSAEVLHIREACNKILHSRRIEPVTRSMASGDLVLDRRAVLHGKYGRLDWRATIDIVEFCDVAASVLETFVGSRARPSQA